jgi:hypothetical protein
LLRKAPSGTVLLLLENTVCNGIVAQTRDGLAPVVATLVWFFRSSHFQVAHFKA